MQSVFCIGTERYKRVTNRTELIPRKKSDKGSYRNVFSLSVRDISEFKDYIDSLPKEPGYPCNHRRQKL